MKRIAAIVLAAGQSSRMGANKLLLPLDGKPLLAHAVNTARASNATSIVMVLGYQAEKIRALFDGDDIKFTLNENYRQGMAGSLKCGLAAAPDDCEGAMIFLGDMPDIDADLINRIIAAFDPGQGRAVVVPVKAGRQGHPVLWGRRFFPLLQEKLSGDSGAKTLIEQNAGWVARVEAAQDGAFADIDTPEAFSARKAKARLFI